LTKVYFSLLHNRDVHTQKLFFFDTQNIQLTQLSSVIIQPLRVCLFMHHPFIKLTACLLKRSAFRKEKITIKYSGWSSRQPLPSQIINTVHMSTNKSYSNKYNLPLKLYCGINRPLFPPECGFVF